MSTNSNTVLNIIASGNQLRYNLLTMNENDKKFKEIANKLGYSSKELIDKISITIDKKRAIKKATSSPYKKRDKHSVRIKRTK